MTKAQTLVTVAGDVSISPELAEFYKENAGVGSENLAGAIPQLKVSEANSQNEGADGQYIEAGQFYYSPTKEAFKSARVSIMAISRGFYAMDNQKDPKPKFTQLVGGMLLESSEPFIMFVSGTRLQNMWNFGKEIKPFTKQVPMFSFTVKLGLEKHKTDFGSNHIVTYEVVRDEAGRLQLITDRELLNLLRNGVETVQEMFTSFIEQKEVDRQTGELLREREVKQTYEALVGVEDEKLEPPPASIDESTESAQVADDVPF